MLSRENKESFSYSLGAASDQETFSARSREAKTVDESIYFVMFMSGSLEKLCLPQISVSLLDSD